AIDAILHQAAQFLGLQGLDLTAQPPVAQCVAHHLADAAVVAAFHGRAHLSDHVRGKGDAQLFYVWHESTMPWSKAGGKISYQLLCRSGGGHVKLRAIA